MAITYVGYPPGRRNKNVDWNSTRDSGLFSGAYQLNNVDNSWLETNQERLGISFPQWAIRNSYDYLNKYMAARSYDNADGDVETFISTPYFSRDALVAFVSIQPTMPQ